MDNLPVITVVIANHNYGAYIAGAIDSVIGQTYPNIQLCIVDDCSTDNSWEIIHNTLYKSIPHEKHETPDMCLKQGIINRRGGQMPCYAFRLNRQVGPSSARNLAIQEFLPNTHMFAILDADDEFYPLKVEKCVRKIMENPNGIGVVYADYDILNTETGVTIREYKEPFSKQRLNQSCIVHSGAVITKPALESTLENTGYYDSTMRTCEDYDLWMRISDKFMIIHIPEALSLVRVTPANSTATVAKNIWEANWQRVMQKAQTRQSIK